MNFWKWFKSQLPEDQVLLILAVLTVFVVFLEG